MAKSTGYYREQCARHGWEPTPDHIVYRANMLVAETDEKAEAALKAQQHGALFAVGGRLREALMGADSRNIAGERARAGRRRIADDVSWQPGFDRRAVRAAAR
jgi:hypothetical protein